eukprot:GHVU01073101.1.p1 GENE.GHVU01073101.1~~GHVU01073101.1.p1  ORF type:complete len:128 (+),score=5.14 GHVU01073101.1:127-510(+)
MASLYPTRSTTLRYRMHRGHITDAVARTNHGSLNVQTLIGDPSASQSVGRSVRRAVNFPDVQVKNGCVYVSMFAPPGRLSVDLAIRRFARDAPADALFVHREIAATRWMCSQLDGHRGCRPGNMGES